MHNLKYFLIYFTYVLIISCVEKQNKVDIVNKQTPTKYSNKKYKSSTLKNIDSESVNNISKPKKSNIIHSKYLLHNIFGIWTYDLTGPHADFQLDKKAFFIVDYDGDGSMPYVLNHDTLKVYYDDFVTIGIIKKANNDSLSIVWDANRVIHYVRWTQ